MEQQNGVDLEKKQIISFLIKNKIIPDSNKINFFLFNYKEGKSLNEILNLFNEIENNKENNKENNEEINKEEKHSQQTKQNNIQFKTNITILKNYDSKSKKRTTQDFVAMFNKRYLTLKKYLQQRQELKSIVPLEQIKNKKISGRVSIIGMILEKHITQNGNLMLEVEDQKTSLKVLINLNKSKELSEKSEFLVEDEVVGFIGQARNGLLFVDDFIFPDIPHKPPKKSPDEIYSVFMSDIHIGSVNFLEEELNKFIKWINGELGSEKHKEIAKKVGYLFIVGDIVDGVGIYPGQFEDLEKPDISKQFEDFENFIKQIPNHIKIIILAGNHDPVRISEPQPTIPKKYFKEIGDYDNVYFVSNPSYINIHKSENFEGFNILLYHGYSFPYYADRVDKLRQMGGLKNINAISKFLLQKRHLSPTHTSNLYIPETTQDPMIIDIVPDIFATGHVHRCEVGSYKNTLLFNCSCWMSITNEQRKRGIIPDPARVIAFNLKTRKVNILNFMSEEKESQ